MDSLKNIK